MRPPLEIAALFVEKGGAYWGLPDVDVWDEPAPEEEPPQRSLGFAVLAPRDARRYDGPHPVVAHPPCARWCRLAGLVEKRWGHRRGEDGGCFAHALRCVRRFGGVLEHPAYSDAWAAYRLRAPTTGGQWEPDPSGGWSCYVEQHRYGHPAKKATWLYAYGVTVPELRWGRMLDNESTALVSWCRNHTRSSERRPRVGKRVASASPIAFRDVLISIARSAYDAPPPP